jgi:hypothetical protein
MQPKDFKVFEGAVYAAKWSLEDLRDDVCVPVPALDALTPRVLAELLTQPIEILQKARTRLLEGQQDEHAD